MSELIPQQNDLEAQLQRLLKNYPSEGRLNADFATVSGSMRMFSAKRLLDWAVDPNIGLQSKFEFLDPTLAVWYFADEFGVIGEIRARPYQNTTYIETATSIQDPNAGWHQAMLNYILSRFIAFWKEDQAAIAKSILLDEIKNAEVVNAEEEEQIMMPRKGAGRKGDIGVWVREQLKTRNYDDVLREYYDKEHTNLNDLKEKSEATKLFGKHARYTPKVQRGKNRH